MDLQSLKKDNKSQLLKRSLKIIETNVKTLVERVGVPVLFGYLNPVSSKVVFLLDSETKNFLATGTTMEKVETVLYASHKCGNPLKAVSNAIAIPLGS